VTGARTALFVATGNRHKLAELRVLLGDLPVRLVGPDELPSGVDFDGAEETGSTFEENADLKAVHAARVTGMASIADDSGLEVDALQGRPGVRSARFAGPSATDAENNAKLVAEAAAAGLVRPVARFCCVVSVASPAGHVMARGRGACEGVLLAQPQGAGGFGYDPHFFVPELGGTFAEVASTAKHRVSHRARALGDLRERLHHVFPAALPATSVAAESRAHTSGKGRS
jgi:XTP/dITP diphosphohydrolase